MTEDVTAAHRQGGACLPPHPDAGTSRPRSGDARLRLSAEREARILREQSQRSAERRALNERSGASTTHRRGIRHEEDHPGSGRGSHDRRRHRRFDLVRSRRHRQLGLSDDERVRRDTGSSPVPPGVAGWLFPTYAAVALAGLLAIVLTGLADGAWGSVAWPAVLFWCVVCGLANLLAAPAGTHTYLSMSAPVNIAVAVLFPPSVAAAVVAVGSISQLEVKGLTTPLRAVFNRTQIGLCAAAAAAVLSLRPDLTVWTVVGAVVAYHLVNWSLVAGAERSLRGTAVLRVLSRFLPRGVVATGTYLSLGATGAVLGLVFLEIGAWAVALLLIPLAGARQAVRATEALQQVERERRALADRLVEEREGERLRIASDLHDTVLQNLAAVQVQADNVGAAVRRADARSAELATAVRSGVDGTIADVRRVIADLRHAGIDGDGLEPTVRRYADAFGRHAGCAVDVQVRGPVDALPTPIALLLLESCQEALTNVAKHAEAGSVSVGVAVHHGQAELTVEDDGRGFRADAQPDGFGLGLTRQKLASVGGGCWVSSTPGKGTRVVVRAPLPSPDGVHDR